MIEVLLVTFTFVAGDPPIITVAPVEKPLPLIVTDVLPVVAPEFGAIAEIAGEGLVDVSKNSSIFPAVEAAPGKFVNPRASAIILSTL